MIKAYLGINKDSSKKDDNEMSFDEFISQLGGL